MTPTNSGTTQSFRPHPRRGTALPGPSGAPTEEVGLTVGEPPAGDGPVGNDAPADSVAVAAGDAVAVAVAAPADSPEDPRPELERSPDPRTEGRRQLRAARRRRRRISIGCAVVIAACTALTLLIVAVARDRSPVPLVVTPAAALAPSSPVVHLTALDSESTETLGALAPQGGHR